MDTKAVQDSTLAGGRLVELLDFGEGNVDLRQAAAAALADHLRQAMQRLRAEYQVHVGRPLHDRRAFLAGHTAADADDDARASPA